MTDLFDRNDIPKHLKRGARRRRPKTTPEERAMLDERAKRPLGRIARRILKYPHTDSRHWMEFYFTDARSQWAAWQTLKELGHRINYQKSVTDENKHAAVKGQTQKPRYGSDLFATEGDLTGYYQYMRCRIAMAYQPLLQKEVRALMRRYGRMLPREDWEDLRQIAQVVIIKAVTRYGDPQAIESGTRFRAKDARRLKWHSHSDGKFVDYLRPLLRRSFRMSLFAMYSGYRTVSASDLINPMWLEHETAPTEGLDRVMYRSGNLPDIERDFIRKENEQRLAEEAKLKLENALLTKKLDLIDAGVLAGAHPDLFTGQAGKEPLTYQALAAHYGLTEAEVAERHRFALSVIAGDNKKKPPARIKRIFATRLGPKAPNETATPSSMPLFDWQP